MNDLKILALETACPPGSVALLHGEQVVAESALSDSQRTMQSLFPEIQNLLRTSSWQTKDVNLIAISIGPGSFTGLRIGVALAKTWAFATGAEVKSISTLDAIARQADTDRDELRVVMDAQRKQLFAATYQRDGQGTWQRRTEVQIIGRDEWLEGLTDGCAISGAGLVSLGGQLELLGQSAPSIHVLPPHCWIPMAATIGQVAHQRRFAEPSDDFLSLTPYYCRRSAAEEKLEGFS